MKALIVESNEAKKKQIIDLLEANNIVDYSTKKFVSSVMQMASLQKEQMKSFDLMITDLALPGFVGDTTITNPREGLMMIYNLASQGIYIPTIIYSPTNLHPAQIERLSDIRYPYLGQAITKEDLAILIIEAKGRTLKK